MVEKVANRFTPEDQETIQNYALEIAEIGDEAIHELRVSKVNLSIRGLRIVSSGVISIERKIELGRQFQGALRLMGEVLKQAVAIRQILGLDESVNGLLESNSDG